MRQRGTVADLARRVLQDAGEPLHYREVTRRMRESGLWHTDGKTPDATVNTAFVTDINSNGTRSIFVRQAPGVYGLREWETA